METIERRIYSKEFSANVHHYFRLMRQHAPIFKAKFSFMKSVYLISRYQDCLDLLQSDQLVKNPNNAKNKSGRSEMYWIPKTIRVLMRNMLNSDGADHRRLRNLVHKAFTPRIVAQLAPDIERITHAQLDILQRNASTAETDFVQDFALPIPVQVICQLIGIPNEDQVRVEKMTSRLLAGTSPLQIIRAIPAVNGFIKYIRGLAQQRRRDPQDDLLSALVQAEDAGDRFSDDELVAMVFLLTVAGHETTVGLLSNAMMALDQWPDQRCLLIDSPELMESAVEEFLRYDSPLIFTELSFAKTDIRRGNDLIPQGAMVLPAIGSANRDESVFEQPDNLDVTRSPNRHLAFGHGIHYCLGAPLARLEASIAMKALLNQLPKLSIACDRNKLDFGRTFISNRPKKLPVRLGN